MDRVYIVILKDGEYFDTYETDNYDQYDFNDYLESLQDEYENKGSEFDYEVTYL